MKDMMKNLFEKGILWILLAMMLIITISSFGIIYGSKTPFISEWKYPSVIVVIVSIFLCMLFFCISLQLKLLNKKKIFSFQIILWTVLLIGQIWLICNFDVNQVTDAYMIHDQARAIADGIQDKIDVTTSYFRIYGNNNFSVIFLIAFYKLIHVLGISGESNILLGVLDLVCIDLSIFFLWRTSKLLKGSGFATKILLISVMNPFSYVILYWSYTLVYSLPLTMGIVYLAVCVDKKQLSDLQKIIAYAAIGVMTVAGYYIRPTVVIPVIALIIFRIFNFEVGRANIKKAVLPIIFFVLFSFITFVSIKATMNYYVEKTDSNFPVTHWVMMGLRDDGIVTPQDIYFTNSFQTTDEMWDANIREIKNILSEYNGVTFAKHVVKKMQKTWSEGTGTYQGLWVADRKLTGNWHWICGQKADFMIIYCQAFRVLILLLATINIWLQIRNVRKDKHFWLFALVLLGAIVFYLIWEAKEIYCVPFLPFLFLLAGDSVDYFECKRKILIKPAQKVTIVLIAATLLLGIGSYNVLTVKNMEWNDYTIYSECNGFYLYRDSIASLSRDNMKLSQTFYADKAFSKIMIQSFPLDIGRECQYKIQVLNDKEKVIKEAIISEEDVSQGKVVVTVPRQKHTIKTLYKIIISPVKPGTTDSVRWIWLRSKASNQYEGKAYLGETEIPDLNIRVYNQYKAPYMKQWKYALCFGVILIIEGFFILQMRRNQFMEEN